MKTHRHHSYFKIVFTLITVFDLPFYIDLFQGVYVINVYFGVVKTDKGASYLIVC